MKKFILVCFATLVGCSAIMGINIANSNESNEYTVAASKRNVKFSNKSYVEMGYLVFTKQKLANVQDNSVTITKNGKKYYVNDNANKFMARIGKYKVTIINNAGSKKSYSKKSLYKKFNKQKDKLDSIINDQRPNKQANENSASQGNNTGSSTQTNDNSDESSNDNQIDPQEKARQAMNADPNIDPDLKRRMNLSPDDPDYIQPTHDPESWE